MSIKSGSVRFIKPPNLLKLRVGVGGIPKETIQKADEFIRNYKADYSPEGLIFVRQMEEARIKAQDAIKDSGKPLLDIEDILIPVMQLKASGGMFRYALVSEVADICQQFIESLNHYDAEALLIIQAHEKTLKAILEHDMDGNGGQTGYEILLELDKACKRYFKKHSMEIA